jgi:hypothetical protein
MHCFKTSLDSKSNNNKTTTKLKKELKCGPEKSDSFYFDFSYLTKFCTKKTMKMCNYFNLYITTTPNCMKDTIINQTNTIFNYFQRKKRVIYEDWVFHILKINHGHKS